MPVDPRLQNQQTGQNSSPQFNLEEIARQKIAEVVKKRLLERTNYQEPDDTCDCDDFVTNPPNAPTVPRRRKPPNPPLPPKPAILAPPLPPPPVRYDAPQLPNAIPPLVAPPPLVLFPRPNIDIEVEEGVEGATATTTPSVTTESPSTNDEGNLDDFWEGRIPCCLSALNDNKPFVTDNELALGIEESTHSGEFRNGCYPMCNAGSLAQYRLGWTNTDGSNVWNTRPPSGFCDREGIQICQCFAKNNPTNPCYRGNGQISPPGANITSTSALKRIPLPPRYTTPQQYYLENIFPSDF